MNYEVERTWKELSRLEERGGKKPPQGTSISMGCVLAVMHVLLLHQPASFCVSWCVTGGE